MLGLDASQAPAGSEEFGRQEGQEGKPERYVKLHFYLEHKDMALLKEQHSLLMKQGQDISFSRMIVDAVLSYVHDGRGDSLRQGPSGRGDHRRHAADGGQSKTEVRG
jgi:hypothetical protein